MGIRREEEMEMSDDESCDSPPKKMRVDESGNVDDGLRPPNSPRTIALMGGGVTTGKGSHKSRMFELHRAFISE